MISGKVGHKQVAHVEELFSSRKVSAVTMKSRGMGELSSAVKSIDASYVAGLKEYNRASMAVQKAKTLKAKENAKIRLSEFNARLNQLLARKRKALALARMIKKV